jgi:hypothetical protein
MTVFRHPVQATIVRVALSEGFRLTVAFHRMRYLFGGWAEGERDYDIRVLDPDTFRRVQKYVSAGLGL